MNFDKIESPIEEILLNHMTKFLHSDTKIIVQYPIKTISGNFRADIALKRLDNLIIIECDGKEFYSKDIDDWYDEWRDALILIQRKANTIYRLSGSSIQNNIYSILKLIYNFDPIFFKEEYMEQLPVINFDNSWYKKRIDYNYLNSNNETNYSFSEIKRKDLKNDSDRFWLKYVLYSVLFPSKGIMQLIEEFKSKYIDTEVLVDMVNNLYPELKLKDEYQLLTLYGG